MGSAFLAGAVVMLILGETLLKNWLTGFVFVAYWLGCFVLTGLTILTSLLDARAVREAALKQQRELLEDALKEVPRKGKQSLDPPG